MDEKYDILNRNVYGMHIKLKNNALSPENPHVCIGWGKMGDLTSIDTKESLSDLHEECFPNKTKNGRVQDVSQIWTFIKTMLIGDYLVYGDGSRAHIGKIVSDYYFDDTNGDQDVDYVNNRKVEWLKSFNYSFLKSAKKEEYTFSGKELNDILRFADIFASSSESKYKNYANRIERELTACIWNFVWRTTKKEKSSTIELRKKKLRGIDKFPSG